MPVLILLVALFAITNDPGETFNHRGNGVAEYEFVNVDNCISGEHRSGFAIAPFDKVVLKQVNPDGTISEPVCSN